MRQRLQNYFHRAQFTDYALLVILSIYLLRLIFTFINFDYDQTFGYVDHQSHWQSVTQFLDGNVLYRDFVFEYGLLNILIKIPFFLIFGQTYYGSVVTNMIVLPLFGIGLSYLFARQLLKGWQTVLFLSILFLFGTNNDMNSFRHLLPEAGLILTMLAIEQKDRKKLLFGSILMALSLISSTEYGAVSHVMLYLYIVVQILRKKTTLAQLKTLFIAEAAVGVAFLTYLIANNALENFIRFHTNFSSSFFTLSPCTDVFPRPYNFSTPAQNGGLAKVLFRTNYYILPVFLLGATIWILLQKKLQHKGLLLTLLGFASLIFIRTIATPCYIHYGMVVPAFILSYFISTSRSRTFRVACIIIAGWFVATSGVLFLVENVRTSPKVRNSVYSPAAGTYLSPFLAESYQETVSYINDHTAPEDYILVYPNGPYYNLTGRRNAIDLLTVSNYFLAPFLFDTAYQKLEERKPEVVIINTHNGPHYLNGLRSIIYNVYAQGDTVVFDGNTTKVEEYITQWYALEKTTPVAWILKRRDTPIELVSYYKKVEVTPDWQINTKGLQAIPLNESGIARFHVNEKQSYILISSKNFGRGDLLQLPMRADLGLFAPFKKYGVFYIIITNKNQIYTTGTRFLNTYWDTHWMYIPKKQLLPPGDSVLYMSIQFSENEGFLPGGNPRSIEIKVPDLYEINKDFHIEKAAFSDK